jgi:hypothetical protein
MLHITKRIIENIGGGLELEPYAIAIQSNLYNSESVNERNPSAVESSMPIGDEYNFGMEVA